MNRAVPPALYSVTVAAVPPPAPTANRCPVGTAWVVKPHEKGVMTFPARSVCLAVMLCVPAARALPMVKLQAPELFAVVVPRLIVPARKSWTVALGSTLPLAPMNVGVVSVVVLSVAEQPVSVVRSGIDGANAVLSIV